jgi:hypothetical protein
MRTHDTQQQSPGIALPGSRWPFDPRNAIRGLVLVVLLTLCTSSFALEPCRIEIVDAENGWPVPLVELRTNHQVRYLTDNAGVIACDAPELMGVETWFTVEGHGYGVPADGFGYRGVRLTPEPGQTLTVKVNRELPAKRLGRLTGAGLFAESQKFGEHTDWPESGILGCDSVQIAEHNRKFYWAWGDTTLPHYPLGLFHMLSATTALKPLESFEPPLKLRYEYFRDEKGKPRNVAEMTGAGPTWLSGYVSLPDDADNHKLVATYVKIKPPLAAYECGLCVWDDESENFKLHKKLWTKSEADPDQPPVPEGHPVFWNDSDGTQWLLFGDPFPRLKCLATFEAWQDPTAWEVLTPQKTVVSIEGQEEVAPHRGSIAWNAYRKKWVTVFTQMYGKPSGFGEIWYAEADSPTGPWEAAVKVVTHNNYTFYNPRMHPELTPADSPILLFEGTYTATFADHAVATPRYDYNQVMYRLDLDKLP